MLQCMDIIIITVAHKGHNANLIFFSQFNFFLKRFCFKLKIVAAKNEEVESQNECTLHKSKVKKVKCEFNNSSIFI